MKTSASKQRTKPKCILPIIDTFVIEGILYFTVDFGIGSKQRWKSDGQNTVEIASIQYHSVSK